MIELDYYQISAVLKPLIFFLIGMVVYALFIFHFYRFLASRDVFKLNLRQYNKSKHPLLEKIIGVILYIIEYILLFPVFTFFWFIVLSIFLSFMASAPAAKSILVIAVAMVGAIRIIAYYKEELSRELAKMLPFALLAIYLVDAVAFSFSKSWDFIKQLPSELNTLLIYLAFIVALEFVLRIVYTVSTISKGVPEEVKEEKEGDEDLIKID